MAVNYTIEHYPQEVAPNSNAAEASNDGLQVYIFMRLYPKEGYTVGASDFTVEGVEVDGVSYGANDINPMGIQRLVVNIVGDQKIGQDQVL